MQLKNEHHTFTGMQRDISISKQPTSFLYDAHNIRLTAREGDTLYTITNEKGTSETGISVEGTYLGHCLLNNFLIVFSKSTGDNPDYINKIDLDTVTKTQLYRGDLKFSLSHPIKAIGSYESEGIQKVYWTDGYNQPRVINIKGTIRSSSEGGNNQFDFIPTLKLQEVVTVKKIFGGSGMFAPGVIQYAFTYYKKYGQETNIFYTTPLYYISPKNRGANPEEKVDNVFRITIKNVDDNFDYLRIYSIQRTSVNGTPICKRIQDIAIAGLSGLQASYTDTGIGGDSVDPTELLYKGGETIAAGTIEQKDGTLFFGNIEIKRDSLASIKENSSFYDSSNHYLKSTVCRIADAEDGNPVMRSLYIPIEETEGYKYGNQLTGYEDNSYSVSAPCGGFKRGETYRCGVQFQHESGKWSDPLWIRDITKGDFGFSYNETTGELSIPCIKGTITSALSEALITLKYKRARAVVCFPTMQDRNVLCQGVLCPTVFTDNHRFYDKDMLAQSSWFFRPFLPTTSSYYDSGVVASPHNREVPVAGIEKEYDPNSGEWYGGTIRQVEIQGSYRGDDAFRVDGNTMTFHSPDIEFNEDFQNTSFDNTSFKKVAHALFTNTFSNISIQTETPTASNAGSGFIHRSFNDASSRGIIAGLFYDDFCLDDDAAKNVVPYVNEKRSYKWMVYPWHRSGSLTNDINRPSNFGVQSSLLKKKVISNLRYAISDPVSGQSAVGFTYSPVLFSSNEVEIVKVPNDKVKEGIQASDIYQGNIDTVLNSRGYYPLYFAFNGTNYDDSPTHSTPFDYDILWKIWAQVDTEGGQSISHRGIYHFDNNEWSYVPGEIIGNVYQGLAIFKDSVRMKYKSTPHLVCYYKDNNGSGIESSDSLYFSLPVVDIRRNNVVDHRFGGYTLDALMENNWIPCGEPVTLSNSGTAFYYSYGDTYYQRWDCLKTYAFTREDINQIVEIGSFMLETRVNIDGRYDRNRGQTNNLDMSPQNFNLLNPVYSQVNNFFNYRILPDDYYTNTQFSNQITWTKEKQSGADVDLWTNVTLGSTYDMDGSKGKVISLNVWKDQIFCFQNKGVSNVLFNSRVQIPASDGVPIEITNSYKVDGYRYISDGIGCKEQRLICTTPSGIYFIDNVSGHLFHIGSDISDVSATHNMSSWFEDNTVNKILYDDVNRDVYLVDDESALCFSEILGQFTSFMDYGGISLIETYDKSVFTLKDSSVYKLFEGQYNNFFGSEDNPDLKPWYFTFISNGVDNSLMDFDKIFTNIDYRMDMKDGASYMHDNSLDYIQVVNEYQNTGLRDLKMFARVNNILTKYHLKDKNLQKKFREWRIQIPRNAETMDRIRNPWCKITLGSRNSNNYQAVLHDLNVQYYV